MVANKLNLILDTEIVTIKDKTCDLQMELKVEVKSDRIAHKTGNMVIELEFKGENSGINATEADVWVWRVKDEYWWGLVTDIKLYLEKNAENYSIKYGGDKKNSKLALIPMYDFLTKIAHRIKT